MERLEIEEIKYLKDNLYVLTLPLVVDNIFKALDELIEYKELKEKEQLLKLPCKVGDTIFGIRRDSKESIVSMKVCEVAFLSLKENGFIMQIMCREKDSDEGTYFFSADIGKTVFLTREEAE